MALRFGGIEKNKKTKRNSNVFHKNYTSFQGKTVFMVSSDLCNRKAQGKGPSRREDVLYFVWIVSLVPLK